LHNGDELGIVATNGLRLRGRRWASGTTGALLLFGAEKPLITALTRAFYWQQLIDDGVVVSGSDIAKREGLHHSTVNELLRLTLLDPAIIKSILAGTQPRCMSLLWFQRHPLPVDWCKQREVMEGFDG
jgi:hypothetical protein